MDNETQAQSERGDRSRQGQSGEQYEPRMRQGSYQDRQYESQGRSGGNRQPTNRNPNTMSPQERYEQFDAQRRFEAGVGHPDPAMYQFQRDQGYPGWGNSYPQSGNQQYGGGGNMQRGGQRYDGQGGGQRYDGQGGGQRYDGQSYGNTQHGGPGYGGNPSYNEVPPYIGYAGRYPQREHIDFDPVMFERFTRAAREMGGDVFRWFNENFRFVPRNDSRDYWDEGRSGRGGRSSGGERVHRYAISLKR